MDGQIIKDTYAPKTANCEVCALSKGKRLISRRQRHYMSVPSPFGDISIDLVEFKQGWNGDIFMFHAYDADTHVNFVWTLPSKTQENVVNALRELVTFTASINRQITAIASDNDRSYGLLFQSYLKSHSITWRPAAPHTPAQDPAERSGGLLITMARCLAIQGNLPENLWPELVNTAAYLLNRCPVKALGYRTPFEAATGKKPLISHLVKIGSRAYPLKTGDAAPGRTDKLHARSHIGYLVGFDSTNIYRVWIPSLNKIVRTRDVIFDEDQRYNWTNDLDIGYATGPYLQQAVDINFEEPESANFDQFQSLVRAVQQETHQESAESMQNIAQQALQELTDEESNQPQQDKEVEYEHPYQGPEILMSDGDLPTEIITEQMFPMIHQQERLLIDHPRPEESDLEESLQHVNKRHRIYNDTVHALMIRAVYNSKAAISPIQIINLPPEPTRWKQAQKHRFKEEWYHAMKEEFDKQLSTKTLEWVNEKESIDSTLIPLTWVWRYKADDNGNLLKFKARLCARGDLQSTIHDTYAATLSAKLFRLMCCLIAKYNMETIQLDAVNAFLNATLPQPIFLFPPDGFSNSGHVLKCHRALYGLKEAPNLWSNDLASTLQRLEFEEIAECLWIKDRILLFFFVDDICMAYLREDEVIAQSLKKQLMKSYEMRDLGELAWFCGIKIIRNRSKRLLWLNQGVYIKKIASRFDIKLHNRQVQIPLADKTLQKSSIIATKQQKHAFQSRVGSLNFAAVQTRPDIAFSVSLLAQHLTNPSVDHIKAADHMIQYLLQTADIGLQFGQDNADNSRTAQLQLSHLEFYGASDASFADDTETRRSSEGLVFFLFDSTIDWKSVKQTMVTKSSTEAELYAISHAGTELIWWERIIKRLGLLLDYRPVLLCDNKQSIRIITQPGGKINTKMRHVDVQQCWLRERHQSGDIAVDWIDSANMPADGFTKLLPINRHIAFLKQLKLRKIPEQQ